MKYDQNVVLEALELYKSGLLAKEVGQKLGIKTATVTSWARKAGITRHRGPQNKIGHDDYFDVIDCEEKAYFLGWLMADGNVSIHNKQYSIKVGVSLQDKEIVEGFLKHLNSENKITYRDKKCTLSLTSKRMTKSLILLGVVPQKSGKEILPPLQPNLVQHFVRGYFDGDGVTSIGKKNSCGFCGGKEILESIKSLLGLQVKVQKYVNADCYYLLTHRVESQRKMYNFMYSEATIWLPRKRDRMDIICGNTEVTGRINRLLEP